MSGSITSHIHLLNYQNVVVIFVVGLFYLEI